MIVAHAFSTGICEVCGVVIDSPHIPCNRVCSDCSLLWGICEVCGKLLTAEEIQVIISAENLDDPL